MPGLTCNACNKEFNDDTEQKLHYKSEWHRYNLKRKVAGVPGVTEALFVARQTALAQEKGQSSETPMLYSCGLCGKGYRSSKAHAEHLKSRNHIMRASQGTNNEEEDKAIVKPLPRRVVNKPPTQREVNDEESEESDWEEADPEEDLVGEATKSLTDLNVREVGSDNDMDEDDDDDDYEELDPSSCFMCDLEHDTIESCMVHMHKQHGFFIPDVEYLKDPEGFLTYLGLKVKRDFMCLYCNDRCQPFNGLEAVRKHMVAKSHCKVHFGDGDDEEEAELEDFYDYSSSYVDEEGKQLVAAGDMDNNVEFGSGGSELIITRRSDEGKSTKTLGSREYMRYYRQKPRPSPLNNMAITAALASRYRSMGLATVQSREQMVRMKVMKQMNRSGVEAMRSKIGMKSNVIRNLPNNVTY
ncbi:cytoplasmic 60S subunit biogenesis factor REI1 homolog 1 isoform X3 [Quercus robur]|uniref:cytoplasmic 60S subunit biogenesis factor REI1 homolog 1 isoform X1 n=1 Tax=Quercus robur TaxID=38942 RepID=UPI002163F4BF|nr:cytoplasmic 60S subunit biogenesis factor REI1 homolog 1 isoform X1 [Quercus robur]XP_050264780.1 cytoplasmic 60S subunit biogenesis factor REI1 homolog 1 isoform X2 [Quercus robur]XP_050264781.1 cytoplasmic 60S subunit biogenesis factor REI1 homolog 1 isoform X3 [Quercus robur]